MTLKLILLLNPVYVTFFWAVVLNFFHKQKHTPKAFLGKFMLVAFVLYLSHLFYFMEQWQVYRYLDSFYLWASLAVYPLYHIYIRLLICERSFTLRQHGKYLILPTIVFLLYLPGTILFSKEQHIFFLKHIITGQYDAVGIHLYMLWVYRLARAVFVAQVFWFLYSNFRLIIKNNRRLQDYYSNTEDRKLQWVQFFNISLAVTSLASVAVALAGREAFVGSDAASLIPPSIIFSLLLFFIGLLGNTQNTVHTTENESIPLEDSADSAVPLHATSSIAKEVEVEPGHDSALQKKLEVLFEEEMIFKNPDLKIWDVCQMLGTNRTYVSKLINAGYERNFCNHVNFYRIRHVKKLLHETPTLPNEHLAELAGFGSINSMYRAFQTQENQTLKEFKEKSRE